MSIIEYTMVLLAATVGKRDDSNRQKAAALCLPCWPNLVQGSHKITRRDKTLTERGKVEKDRERETKGKKRQTTEEEYNCDAGAPYKKNVNRL